MGSITRGTTAPNRLRRVDRWTIASYGDLLRRSDVPLVVDLGFGESPVTTVELADRLGSVRPGGVDVLGLEIDPGRVEAAQSFARAGLSFAVGGFEIPAPRPPLVIRAFNVLRQYDEGEVAAAWQQCTSRLARGGVLIEGTCDEVGRLASWVALSHAGPETFTIAARVATLARPADLAERLPKCLIHRNVPGEAVHRLFQDLDHAWDVHAGLAVFGARQRWVAAVGALRAGGWPVLGGPGRWRLGELTLAWSAVAPAGLGRRATPGG